MTLSKTRAPELILPEPSEIEVGDKEVAMVPAKYASVNGAWPQGELPALTEREAKVAAKRLYKVGFRAAGRDRAFKGKIEITSGNRWSYPRGGKLYVNIDKGWHELVHGLSHHIARSVWGDAHGGRHAFIERTLIQYVVNQGFLDGRLKREPKPPQVVDVQALRKKRILERLLAWERKKRRADTAIRKLQKQLKYYNRAGI